MMALVSDAQWARIYACAWAGSLKKADFEKDPKTTVVGQFGIVSSDTLIDLNYAYDPVATWLSDPKRTQVELTTVIQNGSIPGGKTMSAPTFTFPDGTSIPLQPGDGSITLADWTRMYAYIWLQERFNKNLGCRALFEADPLKGVQQIVLDMKNTFGVTITYTKLLNLGPAPTTIPDRLTDICKDSDAKKYRHKPGLCC